MTTSKRFLLVGSLLRPDALQKYNREIEVREDITYPFYDDLEGYEKTEADAVEEIVKKQIEEGLVEISDGEFSRSFWHLDFVWGLEGIERFINDTGWQFLEKEDHKKEGCDCQNCDTYETRRDIGLKIVAPIHSKNHHFIDVYKRVKALAKDSEADVKLTIPSPAQIYFELRSQVIKASENGEKHPIYETTEALGEALVNAWKEFIDEFAAAGGKVLQLDDCTWAWFAEDNPYGFKRESFYSHEKLSDDDIKNNAQYFVDINNAVIDYAHEKGLRIYTHNCRGNYASRHITSGSYEKVAQFFLSQQRYDRFYLEWDDDRAGNISALAAFEGRPDVEVVVGFLSSKLSELDNEEEVLAELEEAAKYIPKDKLYLSHQCGFASCDGGNELSHEQQWDKIRQGQAIAAKFWGE